MWCQNQRDGDVDGDRINSQAADTGSSVGLEMLT